MTAGRASASPSRLPELVRQLQRAAAYDHSTEAIRHIETHISHVFLCGDYAYKIKKDVRLGFVDFSSLDKRLAACQEEVRLNQRLAPALYLGVVPITGTPRAPHVNGAGEPIEFAVKMRQFAPESTLDALDAADALTSEHVEAIGRGVARFHGFDCARADAGDAWGDPATVWPPVAQNFADMAPLVTLADDRSQLDALQAWSHSEHRRLVPLMVARKREGAVRECHGDLHLGNLAWVDKRLLIFDCLEFDPALRWIDIQSEIAFCMMDLMARGHMNFAWLLINTWLEDTGDYTGLALLRYYAVYRALVRAKIAAHRARESTGDESVAADASWRALVALATRLMIHPWPLRLDIAHGFSGSGKTTITRALMQTPGAIRLRADIERKRMAGLDALASSASETNQGLYSDKVTRATYARLTQLAAGLLTARWPVIVDASCLKRWQRVALREVARAQGVPFHILDFDVPEPVLRRRIVQRRKTGRDASEAGLKVLAWQIATADPLADDERELATQIPAVPGLR